MADYFLGLKRSTNNSKGKIWQIKG